MSDIRFNKWLHQSGTGGVSQSEGGHVGIGTTNPLIPVGSGNTSILNVGVVTANTYYGDGSNLSGIDASALKFGGAVKAQANAAGVVVTGILTATTVDISGDIDVDGHTELDNVNIAGVATFSQGGSEVVRINSGGLLLYNDLSFFGASTHAYWDHSANQFKLNDNTKLSVGSSSDLQIYHGSNISTINDSYGDLRIMSNTLRLQRQAGGENYLYAIEGGKVSLFHDGLEKFETTSAGVTITGNTSTTGAFVSTQTGGGVLSDNLSLVDNKKVKLGTSDDLQIFHDGTHSYIENATGGLYIKVGNGEFLSRNGNEVIAKFLENGAVELYYNNVKKLATTANGIKLNDNTRIGLGDGEDLQIFHDGANSLIDDAGTGILGLRSENGINF